MKIAPKQTESFLKKPPADLPAILFYGPDSGRVHERSKDFIKTRLGESYDPFALVELSDSQLTADPAILSDELSAIHMMAPNRVIILTTSTDKVSKIIDGAQDSFNPNALLIVKAGELSPKSSLRSWFEKHANAAAIACYHDEARDLATVIREHFQQYQIRVDNDVVSYLCTQLGNDRYVTRQELDKLCLYAEDDKLLTLNDAMNLVDYNREANFDDLINAVADRNVRALEQQITLQIQDNHTPITYLRTLQRYFNRLYSIRAQMQTGESADAIIKSLRPPVFFKQVPILTRHVQRWDLPQIARALQILLNAELTCKSNDIPDVAASSRRLMQITQIRA